ncbi:hypothetical protein [Roseibium sp.]|uniref:hypothetical protein n=1 Tax=Roseibium sp. TaxID=1936156 RepID=UPI003BAE2EE2
MKNLMIVSLVLALSTAASHRANASDLNSGARGGGLLQATERKPSTVSGPARTSLVATAEGLFRPKTDQALIVYRDGIIERAKFKDGFNAHTPVPSDQLTELLVSALVLRAVAEGRIGSLEDMLATYGAGFGDADFEHKDLRTLLSSRGAANVPPMGANRALPDDGGRSAREKGRKDVTAVLGRLLVHLYGQPLEQLLQEKIWQPAEAGEVRWTGVEGGRNDASFACCLLASPNDWLKVSAFLLRNGSQKDPFLPLGLWELVLETDLVTTQKSVIGHRINLHTRRRQQIRGPMVMTMGGGTRWIFMVPEKRLVVLYFGVRTSSDMSVFGSIWNGLQNRKPLKGR